MCGIYCSLSSTGHTVPDPIVQQRLQNRGPDSSGTVRAVFHKDGTSDACALAKNVHVTLCSTVLSLRGSCTVNQPYQDHNGDYTLCWNGEAWSIAGEATSGNDTQLVHGHLVNALNRTGSNRSSKEQATSSDGIAEALSQIAGPYAFVLFDRSRGKLFFGRDFLGRRSLLTKVTQEGDVIIASVSDGNSFEGWTEVEADGVYCIDLNGAEGLTQAHSSGRFAYTYSPYVHTHAGDDGIGGAHSVTPHLSLAKEVSSSNEPLNENSPAVTVLHDLLRSSLSLRVLNIPDPSCPEASLNSSGIAKLAILFSGGLDCTVLARLSHDLLPAFESIDLLNVSFENPRIHKSDDNHTTSDNTCYELCPDRVTGRKSYAELQRVCPARHWRFVAIDVPYSETLEHRQTVISLMHPHNTEMDLSIANALYFAARGRGHSSFSSDTQVQSYTTPARVLLSGLGADELFSGYTRHATAYRRGGYSGLLDELELDVARLGKRNLGRDDRVMSHWSKEVRFPYLDEKLLSWAMKAPLNDKCGFGDVREEAPSVSCRDESLQLEPGKKVLRCLAWKLGMKSVAKEKKRAIQFGARTAKMETGKTKGTQLLT